MNNLGKRIKENYEHRNRYYLTKRVPVIIRLDGKAFHTYTKGMEKPFDKHLIDAMEYAAYSTSDSMQGFKCAYVQSDEVSILLTDYDTHETCPWFNYNKSKIESVAASKMTGYFNHAMKEYTDKLGFFDGRAFNIPREEVVNYFLWRAKDWERNSVSMYCGSFYSHKEMFGQGKADQHEMIHKKGKNWATDLSPQVKNGTYIFDNSGNVYDCPPTYEAIAAMINPLIYPEGKHEKS